MNTAMGALMADAQINQLVAVPVGPPVITISGLESGLVGATATDITVVVGSTTYKLSGYITGGITAIKGDYTFNTSGVVTGATYPGVFAVDGTHPAFY